MPPEMLKEKARDELVRLTQKDIGQSLSSLSDKQRSIAATKFFIREIHNQLKTPISDDDIDAGVVDGANDLGCDFAHRDDGHVIIVQSKFRSSGTNEDASSITHFQSILKRFRNKSLQPNKYLKEILSEIDWDSDTFELVFLSFGRIDGQARKICVQIPDYPDDVADLDQRCEWKFFDESDLNVELRGARNLQRGISANEIDLYPVGQKGKRGAAVLELKSGDYRSFIMALDAQQLTQAYERLDKEALFSLNIRNYIGNTQTNKAIIKTAEDDSESFFLFNNGISCLASSITVTDESVRVKGLQVINGAQTVKALVTAAKEAKRGDRTIWASGAPRVLARITEVPDGYASATKIREKITQYNNTQNTIKISDFRSNDDVQANLKSQFGELHRGGRKVAYLPKRTDKIPSNAECVRLEEFSKSVYAFLYDPTAFSGSTSFLFNTDKDGGYVKVFGDGSKIWQRMPDDEFRLRAAIYWMAQEISGFIKKVRDAETDPDSRAALERKWMLLYAASQVVKQAYGEDKWRGQIRRLYRGDWWVGDGRKGDVVEKIFMAAKVGVTTSYMNSRKHKEGFVHRNWMRGRGTPDEISATLRTTVLPLLGKLPDVPS